MLVLVRMLTGVVGRRVAGGPADVVQMDRLVWAGGQMKEVAAPVAVDAGVDVDAAACGTVTDVSRTCHGHGWRRNAQPPSGARNGAWPAPSAGAVADATGPGDEQRGSHNATVRLSR